MKRSLAVFLSAILLVALVGCGSNARKPIELTLSTEDSETILRAAGIVLPEASEVAAAGTTIQWINFHDPFHNYKETEKVNTGYWTFKTKYGCEIQWIETTWETNADTLAQLIISGDPPDFTQAGEGIFPSGAIKGQYQPVDPYINYDDPLYKDMKTFAYDYYSLDGHPYFIINDMSFNKVVIYNRRVIEEYGYDDPADLYANDEWTWDNFYEMCVDFSDADSDRYALDGWFFPAGIMHSSGTTIVTYDPEENKFVSNVDDPRLERAETLLYDLNKNECTYPISENGWTVRDGVEGKGLKDGNMLFYIAGTYAFTGPVEDVSALIGDMEKQEVMLVPLPRDDNGDGRYYIESEPVGYCIIKDARNPEGVALFSSCERFKVIDPLVESIEVKQLREIYLWTDEMLDMYDECYRLASELARSGEAIVLYGDGLGTANSPASQFETQGFVAGGAQSWAQLKEQNADRLDALLAELNETVANFEYTP